MKKEVEVKVKVKRVVLEERTYVESKVVGSVSDSAAAKKRDEAPIMLDPKYHDSVRVAMCGPPTKTWNK